MTGYSTVETAVANAVAAVRPTQFGADLRRYAPGIRSRDSARPSLADFELSLGLPVQRARKTMAAIATTRDPIDVSADEDYLAWVARVHRFLQAIAARAWDGIPAELRTAFFDLDELPPFAVEDYISNLRVPHPPRLSTSATAVGLSPQDLRRVTDLTDACRATAAYRAAATAAARARSERRFLARQRERLTTHRDRTQGSGSTLPDVSSSARDAADEIKQARNDFERDLAAYNELVHRCVGSWLAWAERDVELAPVDPGDFPIAVEYAKRSFQIHATTRGEYWFIKVASPFEIRLDGPLDGIYVCMGFSMFGLNEGGLTDLYGLRLKDLENAA